MFSNIFSENRAVYEIMSKNVVEPERPQMTIIVAHMRCVLEKQGYARASARTHARTHTEKYVIIIAFQRQQWFLERASILRYTYIACFVLKFSP
jgi:hypothetical protein